MKAPLGGLGGPWVILLSPPTAVSEQYGTPLRCVKKLRNFGQTLEFLKKNKNFLCGETLKLFLKS